MEQHTQRLFEAAQSGDIQAVQHVLGCGALVNTFDTHGWAALHYSCAAGHGEVCETLLQWGSDVNATLPDFSTPLMLAAEEGQLPVARLLLERGAQAKCRDENGFTALERCDCLIKAELHRLLQLPPSAREGNENASTGTATSCATETGLENQPPSKGTEKSTWQQQRPPCSGTLLHEVQAGLSQPLENNFPPAH